MLKQQVKFLTFNATVLNFKIFKKQMINHSTVDEMNLKVLRRKWPNIRKIQMVIYRVTIFHYRQPLLTDLGIVKQLPLSVNEPPRWTQLQIYGPLFVTELENKITPFLVVLNSTCYRNTKDYILDFQPDMRIACHKNQCIISFSLNRHIAFATETNEEALKLSQLLSNYRDFPYSSYPGFSHFMKAKIDCRRIF